MRYSELHTQILDLETRWQAELLKVCPSAPSGAANGEIQFFSVESHDGKGNDLTESDEDLPVVVGLGINYGQNPATRPWGTPFLGKDAEGRPEVIDDESTKMRTILNSYFRHYSREDGAHKAAWKGADLVSTSEVNPPHDERYLLVATNYTPVITKEPWLDHSSAEHQQIRSCLKPDHLDELEDQLPDDAIWVIHGKTAVWPIFQQWCQQRGTAPNLWIKTGNLGWPLNPKYYP